jgi:hypothetical protein
MKDPYDEGVANHIGPESCVGDHEVVDRGRSGPGIEPRNGDIRGADAVGRAEGHTGCTDIARRSWTPRGHRPRARFDLSLHENREILRLAASDG